MMQFIIVLLHFISRPNYAGKYPRETKVIGITRKMENQEEQVLKNWILKD